MDDTGLYEVLEGYFPFLKEKNHVISIVGAGGKTTLMDTLARYYARHGCSVVVTTTTHIKRPQSYPVAGNKEELIRMLAAGRGAAAGADAPGNKLTRAQEAAGRIVAAGADAPENKLTQAEEMTVEDYRDAADIVLVEADGAKHLPCKVPADHEPVIPKETTVVLGVMGLDALGKPLHQVCFRKERAMELLDRDAGHCMTEEDLARILASEQGTRKNVGNRAYYIVLNKCDNELQRRQGERIRSLLAKAGITAVACVSLRDINIE